MYEYKARCFRVVDGDTVDLEVDLGFYLKTKLRFRLLDVDTPELRRGTDEEKAHGRAAKERVQELLMEHRVGGLPDFTLTINTEKADSFGRWLARIYYPTEDGVANLSAVLIEEGFGVPYKK